MMADKYVIVGAKNAIRQVLRFPFRNGTHRSRGHAGRAALTAQGRDMDLKWSRCS